MSNSKGWASCKCHYRTSIFSKSLGISVQFTDKATFLRENESELEAVENPENVLEEVMSEVEERKKRNLVSENNRNNIKAKYSPLHKEFFEEVKKIVLVKNKPVEIEDDIFTMPVLDPDQCSRILEELKR